MDRVNYDNLGGFGLVLDDMIKDVQNVRDAIYGLMTAFGVSAEGSFVISGCVWDAITPVNYTAGWICLKGEICRVIGGAVPTPAFGEIRAWEYDLSYDVAGNRNDENGNPMTPYEIRNVKMVTGIAPAHYMPATGSELTLAQVLVGMIVGDNSNGDLADFVRTWAATGTTFVRRAVPAWTAVGGANPFSAGWGNSYSGTRNGAFRKNDLGVVSIRGWVTNVAYVAGTDNVIFTLPMGYRPASTIMKTAVVKTAGDYHDVIPIFIDTNGNVTISSNADSYGGSLEIVIDCDFYNS